MSIFNARQLGLDKWTAKEMANLDNIRELESLADDFSLTVSPGDCNVLFGILKSLIEKNGSGLDRKILNQYLILIKKFGILSLPNRSEEEIKEYFTKDILFIIKNKLPIMTLIKLILNWDKWEIRVILDSYMTYLRANEEQLGSSDKPYKFSETQNNYPSIKNWLKDYLIFSGSPEGLNTLNLIQYFKESENVKLLTREEVKILNIILKLYSIFSNPFKFSNYFHQPETFDFIIRGEEMEAESPFSEKIEVERVEAVTAKAVSNKSKEKLTKVNQLYQQKLGQLQQKFKINQGLIKYKNKSLNELIEQIETVYNQPEEFLPLLTIIISKDHSLKELEKSSLIQKIFSKNSRPIGFREAIKKLLINAGLSEEEAAVFLIYLAKANQELTGLAYIDLNDLQVKWR
jgi:hypothetical protein